VDATEALFSAVRQARDAIVSAARAHDAAMAADAKLTVRRALITSAWSVEWNGERLRALWLVSHPGLRRGGIRKHPSSRAVLMSWSGVGIVQLRGAGARRSHSLVPVERALDSESVHWVEIAPDMPYDTMADMGTWHLLAAHTHAGPDLVREEPVEQGWRRHPEAT
jgi:hypothetical protein